MGTTFRVHELCLVRFIVTMKDTAEMRRVLSAMLERLIRSQAQFSPK
jgi:hypothetical protein